MRAPVSKFVPSVELEAMKDSARAKLYDLENVSDEEANEAVRVFNEAWIKAGGSLGFGLVNRDKL